MSRFDYAKIAPEAIKAIAAVKSCADDASIDRRLRALIELRVSQINGCLYCIDAHSREARQAGESQQRLDCLPAWREAPFFADCEKAALAWAEPVTLVAQTGIPDAEFERARGHFSEKELVDLTVIVAMMNVWNRIAVGFRKVPIAHPEAASSD